MKRSRKIVVCALGVVLSVGTMCWLNWKARAERGHMALPQRSSSSSAMATSLAGTIMVNTTADAVANDGFCSLREAITAANTNSASGALSGECAAGMVGLDNIVFALGAGTPSIAVMGSALPTITELVVINGNTGGSTRIELNGAGAGASADGLTITAGSSAVRGLVINRFDGSGIVLRTNGSNVIENCYFGTNATGTADLGNHLYGIFIDNSSNNTVGGTMTGVRNVISGNDQTGVYLVGPFTNPALTTGNQVLGNFIGTDVTGVVDLGNNVGVFLSSVADNMIGGTVSGARNVISGNDSIGVVIRHSGTTGNQVLGNFIGTDVTGTADLGNEFGVGLVSTRRDIIGGTVANARNIISGNNIGINCIDVVENRILGNFIGTDVTGTVSLSNQSVGVSLFGSFNNVVLSNVISGNKGNGVTVFDSVRIQISGNFIGTDVTGRANLGNSLDGVLIRADEIVVGGAAAGAGNIIAFNGGSGVVIHDDTSNDNPILSNLIFANTGIGIDLSIPRGDGVTPNDPGDSDAGPNNFQNFPVLICATSSNEQTTIQGSLSSLANTSFRIEFFSNDACDPAGNGEGQTFLGFQNVTTISNDAPINVTLPVAVAAGKFITATATRLDAMGNPIETSEFSACLAMPAPLLTINDVSVAEGNAGTVNAVFTVTLSGAQGSCLPVTVNFATIDGTAKIADNDYTATMGTLTFNTPITGNSVTQAITVPIKGDMNAEANETFLVNLFGANNAIISDTQGVGTILSDDFLRVQTADPLVCLGPGGIVNVMATVTNPNAAPATFTFTAALPPQLLVLPGTCMTDIASTVCTAANAVSGTLNPGQTVTITYQAQVADGTLPGIQLCINSTAAISGVSAAVTACVIVNCPTAGPGALFPVTAEVSTQKAGSVLVYNLYSSSVAAPNTQNTRVSLTNTHPTQRIAVHLFFVDGATCSIADSLICLTPNQTASFLSSDIDPGTTGYIVAVASDLLTGCPVNFNFLLGDEFVKLSSGHAANLAAESFAALAGGLPRCDANSVTAVLNFDGVSYNRLPSTLAASSIPSRADGNDTLLVLNRLGGNLATGAATLSNLFGIFYDDAEQPFSFSFNPGVCQFRSSLSNSFPRTVPRLEQIIPAGRSGWAKFYSLNDQGLLGAVINFNPNATTAAGAFNQGRNLHKLRLTPSVVLTIPIFPPNC